MKTLLGDACAHIPKKEGEDKAHYPRIGTAFIDNKDQRISIKIDSIPVANSGWSGWINIFPRTKKGKEKPEAPSNFIEDDVPF